MNLRGLLAFFTLSFVSVAHCAFFDTLLNTVKEIGSGAQKAGDDALGAFMLPTSKCKNGPCSNADKMKILEEHNVETRVVQPAYSMPGYHVVSQPYVYRKKRSPRDLGSLMERLQNK